MIESFERTVYDCFESAHSLLFLFEMIRLLENDYEVGGGGRLMGVIEWGWEIFTLMYGDALMTNDYTSEYDCEHTFESYLFESNSMSQLLINAVRASQVSVK